MRGPGEAAKAGAQALRNPGSEQRSRMLRGTPAPAPGYTVLAESQPRFMINFGARWPHVMERGIPARDIAPTTTLGARHRAR